MRTGAERIAAERLRQISEEGWTAEHDDGDGAHDDGELIEAAIVYCRTALTAVSPDSVLAAAPTKEPPSDWPWDDDWYKPTWSNPTRALAKAGALIAAEIDRLERRAVSSPGGNSDA